ncbi:MAG: hypothetical protein EAZ08_09310 [Cytophagales bacterium]|nr:MAG: hypothetical protein EAZ08_09310 [Cytophagales bacterium]
MLFFCFSSFLNYKSNISFYKKIGGTHYDATADLLSTENGEIILVGRTDSYSQDMNVNVIKLDEQGKVIWDRTYGGNETEEATEIIAIKSGGFLVVGYSDSYSKNDHENDIWLLKINTNGEREWEKAIQTPDIIDEAHSVVETPEGDFVIVGSTTAIAGGVTQAIMVKVSNRGEMLWQKTFGGEGSRQANHIIRNAGGYAVAGSAEIPKKRWDMWLFTTDNEGNMLWQQNYGGSDNEMGNALAKNTDGSYVLAGFTYTFAEGSLDAWVVKTNEKGSKLWDKSFGGLSTDEAFDILLTKENNILIAGYSDIYVPDKNFNNTSKNGNDVFVACLDQSGNEIWKDFFGGIGEQRAYGIVEKADGYILAGLTDEDEEKAVDHLLVKMAKPQ